MKKKPCCSACARGHACSGRKTRKTRPNPDAPASKPKKPSVASQVPKKQIEWIMGNVHVGTPDAEVVADWQKRCARAKLAPALAKACIAYALKIHRKNQDLYNAVMSGAIGSGKPRRRRKSS